LIAVTARTARLSIVAMTVGLIALVLLPTAALAQWQQKQPQNLGIAASWAYSGDDNGYRLEIGSESFNASGGYFQADNYGPRGDGDVYALELGVGPQAIMSGYEGAPFVLGVGAYRFTADDPERDDDDSFSFWLGAGDFDHSRKGLFYQYRYILDGPISGSQGILGWAF
jgi:hypothetical protein